MSWLTFQDCLDKVFHQARRVILKPFPVLLTDFYARLSINPPNWLQHWAFSSSLEPIERIFSVIFQSLRWLGAEATPAQTPAEVSAILTRYLPAGADEIDTLLREYQHALFSQKHINLPVARHAGDMIRRRALRFAWGQRVTSLRESILLKFSRKID